jgi:hypothetical protein
MTSEFVNRFYRNEYLLKIYGHIREDDPDNDIDPDNANVDVEVVLASGERYTATFFTPDNIKHLMKKWSETNDDCNAGSYFWVYDMVVVPRLTVDSIINVTDYLVGTQEFEKIFDRIEDDD